MREAITNIRSPLIDNYIRIIKSLAKRGRNTYHEYLIHPLTQWNNSIPAETMDKLLNLINEAEKNKSKKIPLLYKMALIKSVAPDQLNLTLPGNISLNFLKSMKIIPAVSSSDEALEFVNLLKDYFKKYSDNEFILMNKKFESEIISADTIEVEKLIKIREGIEAEQEKQEQLSIKALEKIKAAAKTNDMPEMKRSIIVYLLKFSDPSMPNMHTPVFEIMEKLNQKNKSFKKEVLDSAAVIAYHEILKAIKDNNLAHAVKFIGKFAVLFRGDPDIPNFREVDSFEKKFFQIIEERNLWDKL